MHVRYVRIALCASCRVPGELRVQRYRCSRGFHTLHTGSTVHASLSPYLYANGKMAIVLGERAFLHDVPSLPTSLFAPRESLLLFIPILPKARARKIMATEKMCIGIEETEKKIMEKANGANVENEAKNFYLIFHVNSSLGTERNRKRRKRKDENRRSRWSNSQFCFSTNLRFNELPWTARCDRIR